MSAWRLSAPAASIASGRRPSTEMMTTCSATPDPRAAADASAGGPGGADWQERAARASRAGKRRRMGRSPSRATLEERLRRGQGFIAPVAVEVQEEGEQRQVLPEEDV